MDKYENFIQNDEVVEPLYLKSPIRVSVDDFNNQVPLLSDLILNLYNDLSLSTVLNPSKS